MNNKTFYSFSFGCRVNEAEKEEIDRQMVKSGFKFEAKKPEIYIINTCSITQKAEREARQLIYKIKKQLPRTKIVITGCAATYWQKNNLYKNLPVDLIISNKYKQNIVKTVLDIASQEPTFHRSGGINGYLTIQDKVVFNKFIGSGRMMVKIQDGCQRFCSYCIVPYLRGIPNSSKINDLVNKINQLSKSNNIKEVILTAINTEAFGLDTGEILTGLLKDAIDKTNIPRISLGSIHPWSVNDDFLRFYLDYIPKKRLVDFFHIPLQSGSNKILNHMKRGYTREEFVEKLDKLAKINPFALIATDIIVGFFDETDSDFAETYKFLKDSPIVKFHIFRYSKRNNTAGYYMAKRLREPRPKEKAERAKILIDLGKRKYEEFLQKNVGRISSVLMLEQKEGKYCQGLLDNQLPVLIESTPQITPRRCNGGLMNVKITEFKKGKLFGRII